MKIALCNYMAGSGKDSVADYLVENYGFVKYAFADGVYKVAKEVFGMDTKDRDLLIAVGEKMREIDKLVWIKETMKRIEEDGHERVIITDTRKLLEYAYVKEHGFTPLMVYCKEEIALKRIEARDGVGNVNKETVLNGKTEVDLRPLKDTMPLLNNSGDWDTTVSHLKHFLKEWGIEEKKQEEDVQNYCRPMMPVMPMSNFCSHSDASFVMTPTETLLRCNDCGEEIPFDSRQYFHQNIK